MSVGSLGQDGDSQEVDLNLAPIIDCFVVLIAFMLVSASFLAIGILDAGIAAAGAQSKQSEPPPVSISVGLTASKDIRVEVSGKATQNILIKAKNGDWDLAALTQNLATLRTKWTSVNAITLTAENRVEYRNIVQTMEVARKTMPVVLLGGF